MYHPKSGARNQCCDAMQKAHRSTSDERNVLLASLNGRASWEGVSTLHGHVGAETGVVGLVVRDTNLELDNKLAKEEKIRIVKKMYLLLVKRREVGDDAI